ncbi:MAG TPA: LysM peptidoglycan-binding domain-containing protein, partial [Longimicrobiaceae bacterium]|nr:LysM peptidoglycan-binding domain-containing protein [Longimicrobiaceae bacterium]
ARAAPRTARPGSGSASTAGAASGSASASAARTAARGRRTHEVQPGETFYGVARKYGVAPADLRAANPGVDPEKLRSGTTLWIPAAPPGSAGAAAAPKPPARPATRTHRVVRGDTLFGIARKYGVSPAAIRAANKMEDDNVRLDQTLVIPGGS